MRKTLVFVLLICIYMLGGRAEAQSDEELKAMVEETESGPTHRNEYGFSVSLASSGLGLGGFYRIALPGYFHIGANLEFFILRDDDEFELIDPFTGFPVKVNDVNNLFLIPLNIEIKKRLFAGSIENNFRPYLVLNGGGIFGMNFPSDVQLNQEVKLDDEFRFSVNFAIGIGADVKTRKNFFVSIRTQYRVVPFVKSIAGKKSHNAFEIKFEIGVLQGE